MGANDQFITEPEPILTTVFKIHFKKIIHFYITPFKFIKAVFTEGKSEKHQSRTVSDKQVHLP